MPVIRSADSRRTTTPTGVMTTLASPTQGGAGQAVWRVDMPPGAAGPPHGADTEQVWTVLDGSATAELADETVTIRPGDTLIIPPGVPRRVSADPAAGFAAIVVAPAGVRVYTLDGRKISPEVAMPDGGKLVPAWVV